MAWCDLSRAPYTHPNGNCTREVRRACMVDGDASSPNGRLAEEGVRVAATWDTVRKHAGVLGATRVPSGEITAPPP